MQLFRTIDRILRGEVTSRANLEDGRIDVPLRHLLLASLVLGLIYGAFMGLYGALRPQTGTWLQLAATTIKVPLLFILTLVVTAPSLYVWSALCGSPLRLESTLRLLLVGTTATLAVLASLGPVTGFFTVSTESYPFMVLLNVVFFSAAGVVGLGFVGRSLALLFEPRPRWEEVSDITEAPEDPEDEGSDAEERRGAPEKPAGEHPERANPPPQPPEPRPRRGVGILAVWMAIYGVVGAQMGWILRPFVGHPQTPFAVFRDRESNFFEAVVQTLVNLFTP